jgi:hypothetical protein
MATLTSTIFVPITCDDHYVYVSGTRQNADGSFSVTELFCEDCGNAYATVLDEEFAEWTELELVNMMCLQEVYEWGE